ncbi:MAG: ABC transporter ATP-binding protein [Lachnospiraceae bacterium]|nr:ABC transporter ATP-binding protein [Lachnospiraceae bacterium]
MKALRPYAAIWLSARLIDELSGARDPKRLFWWVLLLLVSGAALMLAEGILLRWSEYEASRNEQMSERIFMEKMIALDYADIDRQYVYDLYYQIRQNENWAGWGGRYAVQYIFEGVITSVSQIIGGLALSISLFNLKVPAGSKMEFLNHPLAAVFMAALMLLFAAAVPFCSSRADQYVTKCAEEVRMGNRLFSFFGFMCQDRARAVDLRMYRQEENVGSLYLMSKDTGFAPGSAMARYAKGAQGLWRAASYSIAALLTGAAYLFVCLKAWGGAFGVGMVTQYVGAITALFTGLSAFLREIARMCTNGEFLRDYFEFLDIPNQMYQGSLTTEKRADRRYEVEFRDVSFRYPGTKQWALRHVNMKFRVGSRLAVVGVNGSGKTTFIKLLCRLYDPTQGQILLNGIDIRKYRYQDYIDLFSVVFQDFHLLARPLGENVAGAMVYEKERVAKCLNKAGFGERTDAMKEGLHTYLYKDLDENGVEISGGEAQKIAIARTLYKDAPFLILDEPTAALDPEAEAEIYTKFDEIAGDKTAIYISHRLSSCRFCDEIAVFHEGQVIEQGTHEELVSDRNGKYYELWNAQAQYYQTLVYR